MKAEPPLSHPDRVLPPSLRTWSLRSHVWTGVRELPFMGQAQDGLLGGGKEGLVSCVVFLFFILFLFYFLLYCSTTIFTPLFNLYDLKGNVNNAYQQSQ